MWKWHSQCLWGTYCNVAFLEVLLNALCLYSIYIFKLEICCPINPLKISVHERLNYLLNNTFLCHTSQNFFFFITPLPMLQASPKTVDSTTAKDQALLSSEKPTMLRLLCIKAAQRSQSCINVCSFF